MKAGDRVLRSNTGLLATKICKTRHGIVVETNSNICKVHFGGESEPDIGWIFEHDLTLMPNIDAMADL